MDQLTAVLCQMTLEEQQEPPLPAPPPYSHEEFELKRSANRARVSSYIRRLERATKPVPANFETIRAGVFKWENDLAMSVANGAILASQYYVTVNNKIEHGRQEMNKVFQVAIAREQANPTPIPMMVEELWPLINRCRSHLKAITHFFKPTEEGALTLSDKEEFMCIVKRAIRLARDVKKGKITSPAELEVRLSFVATDLRHLESIVSLRFQYVRDDLLKCYNDTELINLMDDSELLWARATAFQIPQDKLVHLRKMLDAAIAAKARVKEKQAMVKAAAEEEGDD